MEISQETKRRIADGSENLVGDIGFALVMFLGTGNVCSGYRGKRYFKDKIEAIYQRYGISYTPRTYLRKP